MPEQIPDYDLWKLDNGPYENDGELNSNYPQARSSELHFMGERDDAAREEEKSDD